MSTISQEESLLLQCLATTSLLGELSNANFLESDYYKQLSFSNKNRECKILDLLTNYLYSRFLTCEFNQIFKK